VPLYREVPVSRAFFYIPLGVPNEQGVLIILKSHMSLEVPGKNILLQILPKRASYGEKDPFPEPPFTYIFTQRN